MTLSDSLAPGCEFANYKALKIAVDAYCRQAQYSYWPKVANNKQAKFVCGLKRTDPTSNCSFEINANSGKKDADLYRGLRITARTWNLQHSCSQLSQIGSAFPPSSSKLANIPHYVGNTPRRKQS
jgi:hypothetical protein